MKLLDIINDNNTINEKSLIGFCSFFVMILFAIADITTGYFGKDLIINEFIYNSFLILTLGAFGFGSIDKYINNKSNE